MTAEGVPLRLQLVRRTRPGGGGKPLLPLPRDWFPADRCPRLEPDIGHWRWAGGNDFIRFYDYGLGDEFRPHFDEAWRAAANRRSLLTVLVYLPTGEPCEGGETVVGAVPSSLALIHHRGQSQSGQRSSAEGPIGVDRRPAVTGVRGA